MNLALFIFHALRFSDEDLLPEVDANIETALCDLTTAGMSAAKASVIDTDPLVRTAVEMYCKWIYDFDGQAERFRAAYDRLKDVLTLSSDYKEVTG